jgi:mono/diheme cytochrome c family protein
MTSNFVAFGTAAMAAVLAISISSALPVLGQASSSSSESASASASQPMSETDIVAAGKRIWSDAACYNCHGTNGQGGNSPDFPRGPNLRTSALDAQTMLQIIECGVPNTRMPAWLKGAYTEVSCYGNPVGPAPADTLVSGIYSEEDLKNLVAYVQVNFMKQPLPTWQAQ